jgi:hypothetical protein
MRVVLGARAPLKDWFEEPIRASNVRNSFRLLGQQAIVAFEKGPFESLLSRATLTDLEKEILSYWFMNDPRIALVANNSDCDLNIGSSFEDGSDLPACLDSNAFTSLFKERSALPLIGEGSQEAFMRIFAKLLPISRQIKLVDKYFFENFTRQHQSGQIVINNILKLNAKAHFYTSVEDLNISQDQFDQRIRAIRLLKSQLNSTADIQITVLDVDRNRFVHDRMGYFEFQRGRLPFALGQGVDSFGYKSQLQPRTIASLEGLNIDDFDGYLRQFQALPFEGHI